MMQWLNDCERAIMSRFPNVKGFYGQRVMSQKSKEIDVMKYLNFLKVAIDF